MSSETIRRLDALGESDIRGLADVLIDCVEGGASVSFMWPMTHAKAEAFWREAAVAVARGERLVLAAFDAQDGIIGTITVVLHQPENQPHRADVAKMLVHRRARRTGVASRLLAAAERQAVLAGKSLLVLDTVTGTDADRLYSANGWQRVGEIPDYALWPDGRPCPTTVFCKRLRSLRPYTDADETACLALFDLNTPAFFAPNERDDYAAFLRPQPAQYRVCVEGAQLLGAFGVFRRDAEQGGLHWILIDPRRQGEGLGSWMMSDVMRQCRELRLKCLHIAASQKSAPFFARFGARRVRETPDGWGPGMHRIDMELRCVEQDHAGQP
jgi:GNAT superfamily N-acetyltransferase